MQNAKLVGAAGQTSGQLAGTVLCDDEIRLLSDPQLGTTMRRYGVGDT